MNSPNPYRNRFGLLSNEMSDIIEHIKSLPNINQAWIFGSRAMGNFKKTSDIDIAIKGNINIDTVSRLHYLVEETGTFPYRVDVVGYDLVENDNLRKHIDTYGIIIFDRDSPVVHSL